MSLNPLNCINFDQLALNGLMKCGLVGELKSNRTEYLVDDFLEFCI